MLTLSSRNSRGIPAVVTGGWILSILCLFTAISTKAQTQTTGSFEGQVVNGETGEPIGGVTVQITSVETGVARLLMTDVKGRFFQAFFGPGSYTLTFSKPGFKTQQLLMSVYAMMANMVIPFPLALEPVSKSPVDLTISNQTLVGKWEAFDLWEAPPTWHAN